MSGCSFSVGFKPDDAILVCLACEWLQFILKPDDAYPWLYSVWVASVLVGFEAWWYLSFALQDVSDCSSLLSFRSAYDICLHSSDSEWLLFHNVFQAWWWWISFTLQPVSHSSASILYQGCWQCLLLISSLWVTIVPCCVSSVLRIPDFGSLEGEWLCALLCFRHANNSCSWLFSWWVTK